MRVRTSFIRVLIAAAVIGTDADGQTVDVLNANTQQLQVQVALDQAAYFPGEAAKITITVANPSSGALQVLAPFTTSTGALCLFNQPPSGPATPVGADGPCHGPLANTAFPATSIPAGAQQQISLNSYENMFDSGLPAMQVPLLAGSYTLAYVYSTGSQAPFSITVPHLDGNDRPGTK